MPSEPVNEPDNELSPRPDPLQSSSGPESTTVNIFAAGSLIDAFGEIGRQFTAQDPTTPLSFTFASADHLRVRIEAGEPADVFAPANRIEIDRLARTGLVVPPVRSFATNRLAIVVTRGNPRGITGLRDLDRSDVKLAAEHPGAPLSHYVRAMLARTHADSGYGPAFERDVVAKLAATASTVREMVDQVRQGQVNAAIVYLSDFTPDVAPYLKLITIPEPFNVSATYVIAVTKSGANQDGGARFVDYVLGPDGQACLGRWGFGPPPPGLDTE